MDGGAWWVTVHRLTESDTTEVTQHTHAQLMSLQGGGVELSGKV